jgi:hypothetical protein
MIKHTLLALALYIVLVGTTHIPTPYFTLAEHISKLIPGYDLVNSNNFDTVIQNPELSTFYLVSIIILLIVWLLGAVCLFIGVQILHQKLKHPVRWYKSLGAYLIWLFFATISGILLTVVISFVVQILQAVISTQVPVVELLAGVLLVYIVYYLYAVFCIIQPAKKIATAFADLASLKTYTKPLLAVLVATALTVLSFSVQLLVPILDITYIALVCIPLSAGYLWHKL